MNFEEQELLFEGVQLAIACQLILVGLLLVSERTQRSKTLGFFSLFLSIYYLKIQFFIFIDANILATLLLSGGGFFFYGPVLYFYISSLTNTLPRQRVWQHLIIPITCYVLFFGFRQFAPEFFFGNISSINLISLIIITSLLTLYFILGIRLFKRHLNLSLQSKARKQFNLFYYSVNIFLIIQFSSALVARLAITTQWTVFTFIDDFYVEYFVRYINIPAYLILSVFLILYSLTQSNRFRSYLLGKKLHLDSDIIEGKELIHQRITKTLKEDKLYLDADLKLSTLASKIGVSSSTLTEFLQNEFGKSFNTYLNELRIAEFKVLVCMPDHQHYTLPGLATMAGFKSKATFNRVFKQMEGSTPSEYAKSLKEISSKRS